MIFIVFLACHIVAAFICVVSGPVAMLSKKRRGRHTRFGTIYYWSFSVAFVALTGPSVLRWATDYDLFIIGALAFGCASVGYAARKIRWQGWISAHIAGMGVSYITLLIGFYVDNGHLLPVWKDLPPIAYWLVPSTVGAPLVIRALVHHRGGHAEPRHANPRAG